ncbi:MAG: DMT family transporter [Acidimicrobiia bacterium]|nr:DMT family transporter [Acidimicrobiia bacterium]
MISTNAGSHPGRISARDWGLLLTISVIWGSSFLWIAIGLDHLGPGVIATVRVALGAASLSTLRASRVTIARSDWLAISIVGVAGNAAPALLFALAEQSVSSSIVGMLNAAVGLVTLSIAFAMGNRSITGRHVAGLTVGLAGVGLLIWPTMQGGRAGVVGVGWVALALLGYGLTNNVLPPLQQKYGGIAVIARAQMIGTVVLLPFGIADLGESTFAWGSVLAVLILGVFGTGVARAMYATILGRVGAPRGSIVAYIIPIVAVILGITFLNEHVQLIQLAGLALVLGSVLLTSSRLKQT